MVFACSYVCTDKPHKKITPVDSLVDDVHFRGAYLINSSSTLASSLPARHLMAGAAPSATTKRSSRPHNSVEVS